MQKKLSLLVLLMTLCCLLWGASAFAGDTLEFTPVDVYWNAACSERGYMTLCGKDVKDDWYFIVKNKSDKTISTGSVVYVLLVDTNKLKNVLTGATLDFFKKCRVSTECKSFTAAGVNTLAPGACAFMGKVEGNSSIEWGDVPIFDYAYMRQEGIVRAGVRINWTVSDSRGFTDSGSYTYYPEILSK